MLDHEDGDAEPADLDDQLAELGRFLRVSPAAGSSSRRSCGSVASARASSTRRWRPYGRLPAGAAPAPSVRRHRGSARALGAAASSRGGRQGQQRRPETILHAAVLSEQHVLQHREVANSRRFWKVRPMPMRQISCSGAADLLADEGDPARLGASTPLIMLIIVLLPAPFGPMRAWTCPCCSRKDTSCAGRTPPKFF